MPESTPHLRTSTLLTLCGMLVLVIVLQLIIRSGHQNRTVQHTDFNQVLYEVFPNAGFGATVFSTRLDAGALNLKVINFTGRDSAPITAWMSKSVGEVEAAVVIVADQTEGQSAQGMAAGIGVDVTHSQRLVTLTIDQAPNLTATQQLNQVVSSVDYLRSFDDLDHKPIILVGSGGAVPVLIRASTQFAVDGLISSGGWVDPLAVYQFLQTNDSEAAQRFAASVGCATASSYDNCLQEASVKTQIQPIPILILQADNDPIVPADQAQVLADAVPAGLSKLVKFPDTVIHDVLTATDETVSQSVSTTVAAWIQVQVADVALHGNRQYLPAQ